VTVSAAAQVGPGNGSPAAAVQGEISALAAKDFKALCAYQEPSVQARCDSQASQAASVKDQLPYIVNPGLGYVVTDGTKALVGTTRKFCVPGQPSASRIPTRPQCWNRRSGRASLVCRSRHGHPDLGNLCAL
jgi:hypothetical protein